jgi:ornithine decarboxylase
MISALGGGFDCASKGEFSTVLDNGFQTPSGIIYAHPCKMINNIQAANRRQVFLTTFDNEEELEKLHKYMPKAQAVLRIATDDSAAVCEFSSKFGSPFANTQALLERARQLDIAIVGVSFHVGSGNSSPDAYFKALRDARDIFDRAEKLGFDMTLLDIGGGFSGSDPKPGSKALGFEQIAAHIRPVIDELFPEKVRVIAEPGRFFAESPYAIAMSIHSKRKLVKRDGTLEHQYYTSDGKYGSYNCMLYDHAEPDVHVLRPDNEAAIRTTTIFGPTCDGVDWIMKQRPYPALDIGDWIFSVNFGAYTVAAGSKFNGFSTKRIEFISSLDVFAL